MRAGAVTNFDDRLEKLVNDMIETMYAAPGVGLAAPQIGVSRRVAVFDAQDGQGARVVINPELVETSGVEEWDEGCLSVPGHYWEISRPGFARVRGVDVKGGPVEYSGEGLMGRVLQHELDHLDGKLLLEQLPTKARKQALRLLREEALGLPAFE
jgi:peptide deformylase